MSRESRVPFRLPWPVLIAGVAIAAAWGFSRQTEPARADGSAAGPHPVWKEADMKSWEKPADAKLRGQLSDLQYRVTQNEATEAPFRNEYWDNHEPGLYVDVISGEPLFSSLDKFESGTGWPSFTRPVRDGALTEETDHKLGYARTEVRSKHADSHLGHVFPDGPKPTGQRYCVNSAALRFVPVAELEAQGYGEYAQAFRDAGIEVPEAKTGAMTVPDGAEVAILAGGCYWGMEDLIRDLPGVLDTDVGFTGGTMENPQYEDLHHGDTGHAESVRIVFDPSVLPYEKLLDFFFRIHDPTTENRQGNDRGSQYRSAIFVQNEEQRKTAERVKAEWDASGRWKRPIVTEITDAEPFWPAAESHQDYLEKHPNGYTCHFLREWDE